MQTYDRILAHSAELFSEHGFEAVSMRDIAKASGIKAPSLYNHFKDKQSLYQATLKAVFDQHNEQLISVLVGELGAEEKLKEVIRLSAYKMAEDTTFRQLILRELLQNDPQKLQFLAETVMAESCKQLEKILYQINPQSDHHFTITSILGQMLFHFQIGNMRDFLPGSKPKHHETDYLAEQIFKSTLMSIRA